MKALQQDDSITIIILYVSLYNINNCGGGWKFLDSAKGPQMLAFLNKKKEDFMATKLTIRISIEVDQFENYRSLK